MYLLDELFGVKLTLKTLKQTCDAYKIPKTGKKDELNERIKEYLNFNDFKANVNSKIVSFQRIYKKYINNKILSLIGPGYPYSRCINEDCPFTLDELNDIGYGKVITWKESDKIYGASVDSINEAIKVKFDPYSFRYFKQFAIERNDNEDQKS